MLLFNLPKLVLPAIAGISIHLMLLFNCVRYYCIYKSFNISIHLMLLFNVSLSFHCMCNNHFNTSNVTIQLIIIDSTTCTYLHFNTSNVTIQLGVFVSVSVTVFISIHLMLLFNNGNPSSATPSGIFQYI